MTETKVNVQIECTNGKVLWGKVSLYRTSERLSDRVNDKERRFLPLQMLDDNKGRRDDNCYKLVFINLDHVSRIEEK